MELVLNQVLYHLSSSEVLKIRFICSLSEVSLHLIVHWDFLVFGDFLLPFIDGSLCVSSSVEGKHNWSKVSLKSNVDVTF